MLVLSAARLARNGKAVTAFLATCVDHVASVLGLHAGTKSVLIHAAAARGLVGTLHSNRF